MPVRSGLERLVAHHLRPDSVIAIAGEDAALLGEYLASAGGPPLSVEADRFALLSDDLDPPTVGRVRDLPASVADLVILRRAWNSPVDVADAIKVASETVRPGGEVVAADVDAERLLAGPNPRYPVRLLYLMEPDIADRLRASTASPSLLGMAAVRAGLSEVTGSGYDVVRGDYDDVEALWEGVRSRGWRGAAWTSVERTGELFESVAPALQRAVPGDQATDLEPWYAVIGRAG